MFAGLQEHGWEKWDDAIEISGSKIVIPFYNEELGETLCIQVTIETYGGPNAEVSAEIIEDSTGEVVRKFSEYDEFYAGDLDHAARAYIAEQKETYE